ncbi:ORF24 [black bullhead herpesvirus]|uniref:ORF24 n=1 Tax=black bullhead herpesvirus TaxID=508441 RepID=A0A2H5AJF9_9VIRU|nr:ORF24 [black bullhead herpesvirus]AUG72280.1 ORF24 [black bullhead herpesvirus]
MSSSIPAVVFTNGTAQLRRDYDRVVAERDDLRARVKTLQQDVVALRAREDLLDKKLSTQTAEVARLSSIVDAPRDTLIRMYVVKNETLMKRVNLLEKRLKEIVAPASAPIPRKTGVYGAGNYPVVPIPIVDYPMMLAKKGFPEYVFTMYMSYARCTKTATDVYIRSGAVTPEFYSILFSVSSLFPLEWFDRNFSISTGRDLDYFCWKLVALRVTTQFLTLLNTFSDSSQLALKTHVNKAQLFQSNHFLHVQQQQFMDLVNLRSREIADQYKEQPPVEEYTKKVENEISEPEDLDKLLVLDDEPVIGVPTKRKRCAPEKSTTEAPSNPKNVVV